MRNTSTQQTCSISHARLTTSCCCWHLQISPAGEVLQVLLDPTGERVATASAATEFDGQLFLGSLMGGMFLAWLVRYIQAVRVGQVVCWSAKSWALHSNGVC
jgi:hypothetical protein